MLCEIQFVSMHQYIWLSLTNMIQGKYVYWLTSDESPYLNAKNSQSKPLSAFSVNDLSEQNSSRTLSSFWVASEI